MENKNVLTKILAIAGTALVWLPLLAPVLFSLVILTTDRLLRFDYLMPAELFPVALLGGALLLWAAWRAHSRRRLIGGGVGSAVGMLVGGSVLADVTGLASGEIEPTGLPWLLVVASLLLYALALGVTGVGGALLLGDLFKTRRSATAN